MPQTSRTVRKHRRIRRESTLTRRQLKAAYAHHAQTLFTLLSVLAQNGGELYITNGTMLQVMKDQMTLQYAVEKGRSDDEMVVRLVHTGVAVADEPEPTEADVELPLDLPEATEDAYVDHR